MAERFQRPSVLFGSPRQQDRSKRQERVCRPISEAAPLKLSVSGRDMKNLQMEPQLVL